ncbi:dual specificity protein phosphatase 15-like [Centruroides sculpturatus]|uniref:dual specificity protein phosphatase 15-like n=1 Tax=Centruroides sculpturatus TaxID=218467 RepID=UPI000C6E243E|nr:dual specificity protein phosphatase 15-like [Centruroides sculpturatus]
MEYLCIQASDSPGQNLTQFFSQCNDFIHNARLKGGKVLIHCLAGVSRSVTIVVAYIMSITSLNSRDALKVVRNAREIANPNVGFQKQLNQFESYRLTEERRRMKDNYPDLNFDDDEIECQKVLINYHNSPRPREACICRRSLQPPPSPRRSARSRSPHSPSSPVRSRSPQPSTSPTYSQLPQAPASPVRNRALVHSSSLISHSPPTPPSPVRSRSLHTSSSNYSRPPRTSSSPIRSRSPHSPSSPVNNPSQQLHNQTPQPPPSPARSRFNILSTTSNNNQTPPPSPRRSRYPFMGIFRSS